MHIKAAICDDEINIQFTIEKYLQNIFKEYAIEAEIECFDSGDKLCDAYKKGKMDLIFLDIEYKGRNGVAVGKYIRETIGDETVQIAYVSGNTGYAMELFEYRPINFLVKPISQQEIRRVIDKYLILSNQKIEKFQYKIGKSILYVSLSDIVYFSSRARKITLHGRSGTSEFYGSLEQIYNQVKGKQFLYVHKSFIINYQCIQKMEYEQVTLIDGTIIPISQSRRSAIRKQFLEIKKRERQ
ncbi:MAG: response regulator transcription factor [Lachnospiraceae bacterium]|nr:response regulator transcription factor [Lachnospiraceae bacterium]